MSDIQSMALETDVTGGRSALGIRSDGSTSIASTNKPLPLPVSIEEAVVSSNTMRAAGRMESAEGKQSQAKAWPGHHGSSNQSYEENKHEKKIDKRSPSYIIRSGLAGGLAGCAVSLQSSSTMSLTDHLLRRQKPSLVPLIE